MTEQPRTRQELFDRIREVGREEFILEEMKRYGFWESDQPIPQQPLEEQTRQNELYQELSELRSQNRLLHNQEAIKKRLLEERLAESKRKQQETKVRREREKIEKAEAWRKKQAEEIIYLGENVSGGLNHQTNNQERLEAQGLPIINSHKELAQQMGITLSQLRFLSYHRPVSTTTHYVRFKIPKKTGGERIISAPMPNLKKAQYWILHNILEKLEIHPLAQGFRKGHSIMSNAQLHVNTNVVISLDLKDFFPSISYRRVKGLFYQLGYSESLATIFALICTTGEAEKVELDGKIYYVSNGERTLPQGSPASPAITNLLCRRLDKRLEKLAESLHFSYSRYADDLTFSSQDQLPKISKLLRNLKAIITHEGFNIHPDKMRIMWSSRQQEVTGIVVNEKLSLDRNTLRNFKALLFQIEKDGLEGKTWGHSKNLLASIQGYANYVSMVKPELGEKFKQQILRIKEKWQC